jgi:hypothetical protein
MRPQSIEWEEGSMIFRQLLQTNPVVAASYVFG